MIINHNIPALNTYNRLVSNNAGMSAALEKLSSGLRINKAADDAAGLAISEKMRSQIRGLDQAVRNAQDGISLIQTAEGALNETHSILQRMRELSVQAANDTYTSEDRLQIQKEIDQLTEEIDRIAATTQFNGKNLLNGDSSALTSTDNILTKVFMRDGLRIVDQFGQKEAGGGNYKIQIDAEAGVTEVQKTDIMTVKHDVFEGGKDQVLVTGINATFGDLGLADSGQEIIHTGAGVYFKFQVGGASAISGSYTNASATTGGKLTISVVVTTGTTLQELYDFLASDLSKHKIQGGILSGRNIGDIVFVQQDVNVTGSKVIATSSAIQNIVNSGSVSVGYGSRVGMVAQEFTRLRDIAKFWDASGNFILEQPQTINLTQGNGYKTSVTLYDQDTVQSVTDKLNAAIFTELKQNAVVSQELSKSFVTYVANPASGAVNKSVQGTWVIESAIAGNDGKIAFSGNDSILNAFSLMTIREAKDNIFTATITDAHTNAPIATNVRFSGNMLIGLIHPNVDVKFDSNADLQVVAGTGVDKGFKIQAITGNTPGATNEGHYVTYVHIADRTLVLHVGANQKQDIGVGIGDMSAEALGVENLLVTDNTRANQAIGKLDTAINRVSSERAKLGAVQNRLDHTINNLTTSSENLTAAESRIRDVDMAKEMMNFTKYQILANAATSMLAQANQMPQTVLQLLR